MPKRTKNHPLDIKHHIGNDFVFLYLQLIGYPDKKPGYILVRDLKNYRFERLSDVNLCKMLITLQEDGALEIKDKNSVIKITKKTISFIQYALDRYIERFIKGELIPYRNEPYKFTKQKGIFLEKIEERIKDSQSILNFSDADFEEFGEKFCFFPCVLALEKQKEIEVVSLYNERKLQVKSFYNVAFKVKDKQLKELGAQKEKRNLKLRCFARGADGYFQVKKDSTERKIGPKKSRHFLLWSYLVHKGIGEKVNFDQAYKTIEAGKHYNSSKYADEKERVITNAIKSLQKEGRIKPYQIIMDKRQRKIWFE